MAGESRKSGSSNLPVSPLARHCSAHLMLWALTATFTAVRSASIQLRCHSLANLWNTETEVLEDMDIVLATAGGGGQCSRKIKAKWVSGAPVGRVLAIPMLSPSTPIFRTVTCIFLSISDARTFKLPDDRKTPARIVWGYLDITPDTSEILTTINSLSLFVSKL